MLFITFTCHQIQIAVIDQQYILVDPNTRKLTRKLL
jgi:hypothetical protein